MSNKNFSPENILVSRCNEISAQAQHAAQERIQAAEIIRQQLKTTVDRMIDSQIDALNSQMEFICSQVDNLIHEIKDVGKVNTTGGKLYSHLKNNPDVDAVKLIAIEHLWEDKLDSVVEILMTVIRADMNLRVKEFKESGWSRL